MKLRDLIKKTISEVTNKISLKKILDSNQAYALLDSTKAGGSTWAAGGCAILAFALNKAYGYPVYVLYDENLKQADHFVVKTSRDTFIDYDGEQKNIVSNFVKREGIKNKLVLMPYGPGINTPGIVFDDKASEKLAQMIKSNGLNEEFSNHKFNTGDCDVYAVSLHRIYGYPLYVMRGYFIEPEWGGEREEDFEDCHIMVKLPNGNFFDSDGEQTKDEMISRAAFMNKVYKIKILPIDENTALSTFSCSDQEDYINRIIKYIKKKDLSEVENRHEKNNSELIKESSSPEVKRLQKLLADKEKWFQYNGYGKPGHQYWEEKENEVKQIRQKLFDLTGDAYGISQADKDKKKIKPDGVDAVYNHPSEIPIDVYNWVSSNMSLLTSDATDAVRWGRIINTQDDSRYPRGEIMLYRAVDDASYDEIRPGDWVTADEKYAIQHNNKYFDGKGEIISMYADGRDVLVSPTGNYEEAIYAPMELSGPLKKKIRESYVLNEGEIWRQGGMVLIKGAPLEDGSQRLFTATVVDTIELKPAQKAGQGTLGVPGKSASNPVQMVILGNDFYRIKQDEFNLKAHKIDYRSDASLAKVLNFNKQRVAVVLNNNKTPFWWETLKFRDIATMFNQMGSQIMRAKNVNFYN